MAGDWIPMRLDLPEDPAVIGIATRLDIEEDLVVGKLHRFWSWASRQTSDGNAPCVTPKWIDRYLSAPGFAQAMAGVGWLELLEHGVRIPKFDRHMAESAKNRALTAKRVARHRAEKCNAASVTKTLPQNRTEEKRTEEITSSSSLNLDGGVGEDFSEASEKWAEAAELANEVCQRLDRKAPRDGRDRRLIISAAYLSLTTLGRDWLLDGVEQTARKRPGNTWGYLRGVLLRQAEARGKDLDALLAGLQVPERYTRKETHGH